MIPCTFVFPADRPRAAFAAIMPVVPRVGEEVVLHDLAARATATYRVDRVVHTLNLMPSDAPAQPHPTTVHLL